MREQGGDKGRTSTNTSCGRRRASRVHFSRCSGGKRESTSSMSYASSELQNSHLAMASSSSISAARMSNREGNVGSCCGPFISHARLRASKQLHTSSPSNEGWQYSHQVRAVANSNIISSRSYGQSGVLGGMSAFTIRSRAVMQTHLVARMPQSCWHSGH